MSVRPCPECGTEVSDAAIVCPRCGFPLRPQQLYTGGGPGGRSSGMNAAGIVVLVVAAGFGGIVLLGILAALAIPRFSAATNRVKEQEADVLLKQAYTMEQAYRADHDAYAPDFEKLTTVGWSDPPARYYRLSIANAEGDDLCIVAVPRNAGVVVPPRAIDTSGRIHTGADCEPGETSYGAEVDTQYSAAADPQSIADRPGESGEKGAIVMLGEVYAGAREYRAAHGEYPTSLADLLRHVHDTKAAVEYLVTPRDAAPGELCVVAFPRPGTPGGTLSLDGEGRVHRGRSCDGPVIASVNGQVSIGTPSATP